MLLHRGTGEIRHARMQDLVSFLEPGTVMVLNDAKVLKARLIGVSEATGGRVEFILLEEQSPGLWKVLASKAGRQKPGKRLEFPGGVSAEIVPAPGESQHSGETRPGPVSSNIFRYLHFSHAIDEAYLEQHGHVPLPPYIRRADTSSDAERYQTVYARNPGSSAAPTAGLHLTEDLLQDATASGITVVKLTLHVGAGTFLPIRTEEVENHIMHEESYWIPEETAGRINAALQEKASVLAVGTTVVRALESAFVESRKEVVPGSGRTSLFIYPGYRFKVVTQLMTNFHTPRSSLLVLVAAFAGRRLILDSYAAAIREGYRFFSYGDAMFIQ